MSRVQLALNVEDLDASVDFYSKMFGTEPAKRRPGYANFAIENPPLKLVLMESEDGGTINHLGVEVASTAEVHTATDNFVETGLVTRTEDNVTCCYAVQDKVWVNAPDNIDWEIYTVLADANDMEPSGCCGVEADDTTADTEPATAGASSGGCC